MKTSILSSRFLAAVFVFTAAELSSGGMGAQEKGQPVDLSIRFREEAPIGWDQIRKALATLQFEFFIKSTVNGKEVQQEKTELKQNANCKMHSYTGTHIKDQTLLRAYNPDYTFSLIKASPGKPWVLQSVGLTAKDKMVRTDEVQSLADESLIFAPISVGNTTLRDLVDQQNFKIVTARLVERENRKLVELSFTNKHPWTTKPLCPVQGGTLYLDPVRSWCLTSAIVDTEHSNGWGQDSYEVVYVAQSFHSLVPQELINRGSGFVIPDGKSMDDKVPIETNFNVQFHVRSPNDVPRDNDFYLSAFGLPEPMGIGAPSSSRGWYLWITFAGSGILLIGLVLASFRKRKLAATFAHSPLRGSRGSSRQAGNDHDSP